MIICPNDVHVSKCIGALKSKRCNSMFEMRTFNSVLRKYLVFGKWQPLLFLFWYLQHVNIELPIYLNRCHFYRSKTIQFDRPQHNHPHHNNPHDHQLHLCLVTSTTVWNSSDILIVWNSLNFLIHMHGDWNL